MSEQPGADAGGDNQVVCPTCGRVRLETPPGTTALPTIGLARKAAGEVGECNCQQAPHDEPSEWGDTPGDPGGPGTTAEPDPEP